MMSDFRSPGAQGPSGTTSTNRFLEKHWDKGTFGTIWKSIEYHIFKHPGLSPVQYTQRALQAFNDRRAALSSTVDMSGRAAVKVNSPSFGSGLFTPDGKIIFFVPRL
jgi:hypothetical protein